MKITDLNSEAVLNRRGSEGIIGVKEVPHSLWDQEESPEAELTVEVHGTLADTCMLFSCMIKMASEILPSMGSSTDLMLKGPLSLSATSNIASANRESHTAGMLLR